MELSQIPTPTLQRMQAKVRTLLFVLLAVDMTAVVAFALLMMNGRASRYIPFVVPVLLLPTIALVPVVGRLGAISLELRKRAD